VIHGISLVLSLIASPERVEVVRCGSGERCSELFPSELGVGFLRNNSVEFAVLGQDRRAAWSHSGLRQLPPLSRNESLVRKPTFGVSLFKSQGGAVLSCPAQQANHAYAPRSATLCLFLNLLQLLQPRITTTFEPRTVSDAPPPNYESRLVATEVPDASKLNNTYGVPMARKPHCLVYYGGAFFLHLRHSS